MTVHESGELLIHVSRVNEDRGYVFYDEREPVGDDLALGDIFRHSLGEFGRCTGRVYVDTANGVRAVGWVFEKRERYEDTNEPYLCTTWITPERVVKPAQPTILEYAS